MAPRKKRSTGKGKPSRATGPGLSIMSDPTRGGRSRRRSSATGPGLSMRSDPTRSGMSFKNTRKWRKAEQAIAGLVDPTRFEKGAIKATRHMGREISPGTALPGPVPVSVWPKSQAIIIKRKTKKGVPRPESFWYNTSTPSSGPSSAQRGNISQPIDQAPPRSYKAALAQNIANGERQRMRPFLEAQPELSPAKSLLKEEAYRAALQSPKNKRKRRGSPPPPPRGRTTINYRI